MADAQPAVPLPGVIILCYHDIPKEVHLDEYGVDRETFVNTLEYFRSHGFHFISAADLLAAQEGKRALPEKAILLTFDDAYASYYEFVFPLLQEYQIPSVLAVVSSWLDQKPLHVKQPLMTWDQVKEVTASPLVEIASHSHDLHKGIIYNPQGNEAASAVHLVYDIDQKTYEPQEAYRNRLAEDLTASKREIEKHIGQPVRIIVWPYGKYNALSVAEAQKAGFVSGFALNDKTVSMTSPFGIERFLVHKNPLLKDLLRDLGVLPPDYLLNQRILQVDLDWIYDENPDQVEKNLSQFLDRVKALKVSTVILQAFADPQGTGNPTQVYFPNSILPMRMDLFNRVAHQLRTRCEVAVYAWMPVLAIVLPDKDLNKTLRVREYAEPEPIVNPDTDYLRLSPFSPKARELMRQLYSELAMHSFVDGILFQDDGYLDESEDFHPDALPYYKEITGGKLIDPEDLTFDQKQRWTRIKTRRLIEFSLELMAGVKVYRPEARAIRNLYAPVLDDPAAEARFAQNYEESLKAYDQVAIMAYPYLEEVRHPRQWMKGLVRKAGTYPGGLAKTIFKVQTYDWVKDRWIPESILDQWLRDLISSGARHVAYYPDDYVEDHPKAQIIRFMMSTEDFPFKR